MEAQFLSGELLSNPHFLRGGGGCHDVWNPKPVWMFGYELLKVTPEL